MSCLKCFGDWQKILTIVTLISLCVSLAAAVIAFGTDHWIIVQNKAFSQQKPPKRHEYFPRHYGILRECFDGGIRPKDLEDRKLLRESELGVFCHFIDHQVPRSKNLRLDDDQKSYIHLLRSIFVLGVFAIASQFFALIAFLFGISRLGKTNFLVSIILSIVGSISLLILLILFHFRIGLEWNTLTQILDPNDASGIEPLRIFVGGMSKEDRASMRFYFSWSYVVTWFGIAFATSSAILTKLVLNQPEKISDYELSSSQSKILEHQQTNGNNYVPPPYAIAAPKPETEPVDIDYFDPRFALERPSLVQIPVQYF